MSNELAFTAIYEYLQRITSEYENQLIALRRNVSLKNADTVDIIDYIETRVRYQTACDIQRDIAHVIAWGRKYGL